jgi:hypothetical protein
MNPPGIDPAGVFSREPEPAVGDRRDHEQRQKGAHPIVGKPLPQLGEKQRRQSGRVASKD